VALNLKKWKPRSEMHGSEMLHIRNISQYVAFNIYK